MYLGGQKLGSLGFLNLGRHDELLCYVWRENVRKMMKKEGRSQVRHEQGDQIGDGVMSYSVNRL
jgi:hypothetical protein